MVSSWLPKSTLLLVGLLAASASTATAANSDADGHLPTTKEQQKRQHRHRRRASLRAAATPDAIDAEADPVDDMIQPFQLLAFDWAVVNWKNYHYAGHIACVVFYLVVSNLPTPKKKEA